MIARVRARRTGSSGQALVEFSMVIVLFLVLLMAVVDLGRGIYVFNGVSQAAREIARTTSTHPGTPLGQSAETLDTVGVQRNLIPGLVLGNGAQAPYTCLDDYDAPVTGNCRVGDRVKVTVSAPFSPVFGLFKGSLGDFTFASNSTIQITNR